MKFMYVVFWYLQPKNHISLHNKLYISLLNFKKMYNIFWTKFEHSGHCAQHTNLRYPSKYEPGSWLHGSAGRWRITALSSRRASNRRTMN